MLKKLDPRSITIITWACRILTGCVFILSGFTKGIDPWGTIYKLQAYATALQVNVWDSLLTAGAFALSGVEFATGVMLLLGCFRRAVSILALLMMAVMLPLTLWIAIETPVPDCGCFGEALHLSNWATFGKNILLSACVVWLLLHNRKAHWLVTPALQWIAVLVSSVFILVVESSGYAFQPLIDFGKYKKSTPLFAASEESGSEEYNFVYSNGDRVIVIGENDTVPSEEEGWKFVERRKIPSSQREYFRNENEKDFRIWDIETLDDVSDEVISGHDKMFIVMIPDIMNVSPATTWKLNSLYSWAEKHNLGMVGVIAGSPEEIDEWEDLSMARYPLYTSDDTMIKEVVRGNPGIIYAVSGNIVWKSSLTAIDIDDFQSPKTSSDASTFVIDGIRFLRNCFYICLTILAVLVFLSFSPTLGKYYVKGKRFRKIFIHGGKVRLGE